jgi:hypothetical protein
MCRKDVGEIFVPALIDKLPKSSHFFFLGPGVFTLLLWGLLRARDLYEAAEK